MTTNLRHKKASIEEDKISLSEIKKSDFRFLYDLLCERDPQINISHKKMPSYKQHVKFVLSKPYSNWYVIKTKNKKVGSIYLSKQNEIGIFIKKQFHNKSFGHIALKILIEKNPRSRYLANVNPKNLKSKKFFEKNDFKLIQHTYEITPSKLEE